MEYIYITAVYIAGALLPLLLVLVVSSRHKRKLKREREANARKLEDYKRTAEKARAEYLKRAYGGKRPDIAVPPTTPRARPSVSADEADAMVAMAGLPTAGFSCAENPTFFQDAADGK